MPSLRDLRIMPVWHALGGGEIRRRRARAFWRRKADGWNVAIDEDRGTWFDHVSGTGGGPLRLVEVALGVSRRDALRSLEDLGLIDARDTRSPERQAARRRAVEAENLLSSLGPWRRMRRRELDREKLAALEAEDFDRLERAASLLHRIENGEPAQVIEAYREHQRQDPQAVQRLIEAAADDEAHARRVAAIVAILLGMAEHGKAAA